MTFVPSARSHKSGPVGFAGALLATTALIVQPAQAQVEWEGTISNDWFVGANWIGGIIPGAGDQVHVDAFIPHSTLISGGAAQSGTIAVGYSDVGILFISSLGGSLQTTGSAQIGELAGSLGIATVLGEWDIDGALTVGDEGNGALSVESGGAVENTQGYIGFAAGSLGEVTVTGAGSEWINSINVAVGVNGNGVLTVADGGAVQNGFGYVGFGAGSAAAVTVTGAGSEWMNFFDLHVGLDGSGTLLVEDGGAVESSSGYIGTSAGSLGAVTVTGAGSSWSNISLFVGNQGSGMLDIADGGVVESVVGRIGATTGSSGAVTVSGAGSSWTNSSSLFVGNLGSGQLTVLNEAEVVTSGSMQVGIGETGAGSVVVADADMVVADTLVLGLDGGSGDLSASGLTSVNALAMIIGGGDGSLGNATVSGGAALNTTGTLLVGYHCGVGNLTVNAGGEVNATGLGAALGWQSGSLGGVSVLDGGQLNVADQFIVGLEGIGSLNIAGAGVVEATGNMFLGVAEDGLGIAAINGAGSSLSVFGTSHIGQNGQGDITVADGGTLVTSGEAFVGEEAGALGVVTVDGTGSNWFADGGIALGSEGTGVLNIQNGGVVTLSFAPDLVLGREVGGEGYVFIGNGTFGAQDIEVGNAGFGAVLLDTGADIDSLNTTIGVAAGGEGLVVVGDGGFWENNGNFTVGGLGRGTLMIDEGGILTNGLILPGNVTIAEGPGSSGVLIVNGLLHAGGNDIVLNSGGILSGNGNMIANAVNVGGTIAPGNSIGTLNVAGDITFDPGSVYEVEINAAGESDLIHATGSVTLDGGTVLALPFPDLAIETPYTIITADGGIAGAGFDEATFPVDLLFISPVLSDDANNVYLTLSQTVDFADVALTPNQSATASGIQSVGSGALFGAVAVLGDPDQARAAFDASSGEIHASAKTALVEESRFIRNAANDRIRAAFATAGAAYAPVLAYGPGKTPALASPDHQGPAFWGHGFGSWGSTNSDGNAAGLDRSSGGLLIGADTLVGDWRLGILGGYSHSSFKAGDRASSGTSRNYHLGLYGGTEWGNVAFRTGAAYTRHDLELDRSVAFPGFIDSLSANYSAHTWQAFGELGYGIEVGPKMRLEPFANLAHVRLHRNGFTEQGGAAALSGQSGASAVTFTTLGLRGEHNLQFGSVDATLRGMIGWRHAFGQVTPTSTHAFSGGEAFAIAAPPIARNSAVIEAGFDLKLTSDATLGLSYSGVLARSAKDHGFKADLSVRF